MADPENPIGGGGGERKNVCGRRLPTSSNATLSRFLIFIVKLSGEGLCPLGSAAGSGTCGVEREKCFI